MVDIQTERSFKVENGVAIAIKTDRYKNGPGKNVVRTLEEHDITIAEMDEVILTEFPKEIVSASNEEAKLVKEHDDLETELKNLLPTEEDVKSLEEVKVYLESEKVRKCMSIMNKQKALQQGKNRIVEIRKTIADLVAWKEQMEGLKAEYMKAPK